MTLSLDFTRHFRQLTLFAVFVVAVCCSDITLAQSQGVNAILMGRFREPWAFAFLPDGRVLVTEKPGTLKLLASPNEIYDITGVPAVVYSGQGGLGDIVLHPDFANNKLVYLSYAERGTSTTAGAAVARARLELTATGGTLVDLDVIWRQWPKVAGTGHYSHRIAFDADGYLWITSGERQQMTPAQQMENNLGKILRLHDDGSVPSDNPFVNLGGIGAQIWSLGHRNILGIAFDPQGRLWDVEMGPQGGDELNLIVRGDNYGWPIVSNGNHYDGRDIPDHSTRPDFNAPELSWTPVISPSSLMFYSGSEFPDWQGDAFISGLTIGTVSRIEFNGDSAREAQRFNLNTRVRAAKQGPEGGIWLLEDGQNGRLVRYTSRSSR
ncbi:MAG: PQQ-dependent sugar dehydrogenase [Pseudomonadota bacterium]